MDSSTIKMKTAVASKYRYIFVDETTGLKQSIFTCSRK